VILFVAAACLAGPAGEPLQRLAKQPKTILWAEAGHQALSEEHRSAFLRWLQESLK
jgi:hypothetical protein